MMCLALIVPVFAEPLSAIDLKAAAATGEPIYVLAGGDFQESGDHSLSAQNVTDILTYIKDTAGYTEMDGFLFVGDYDCDTHDDLDETQTGIEALMEAVQGKYSNLDHDNSILVQGNHDHIDAAGIDKTGGYDFTGYSVYVLGEDDYPAGGGNATGLQTLAGNMRAWLNEKLEAGYTAPIFITSHVPLAYGPRSHTNGDGKYAKYLFDVLNEMSEAGLNIIFMHGHDHAWGADNYLGGEAIYLKKGDKINIAEIGSTTAWTEETLKFTYMNAGYVGYYNESGFNGSDTDNTELTMTVFKIESDKVTVERYSANEMYNMKSAGRDGQYSASGAYASELGLEFNETVYESPQIIELSNAFESEAATIGKWVGITQTTTDDVTPSAGWVEIVAPVNGEVTYTYELANIIESDKSYLIGSGDDGNIEILNSGGSTISGTAAGGVFTTASDVTDAYKWVFSGSENSYTIQNADTEGYLYPTATRSGQRWNYSLETNGNSSTNVTVDNNDGALTISRYVTSGNRYTTSYMTNGFGAGSSGSAVYLYEVIEHIGESSNGTYQKLVGDLSYNVEAGTAPEAALAQVRAGLSVYQTTAASSPSQDATGVLLEGAVLDLEWIDEFDGSTAGDYAVRVSYNGMVLGTAEVVVPPTTTYYIAEGPGLYTVEMDTEDGAALAVVKAGVTVSSASDANGTDKQTIDDSRVTWSWVDEYDPINNGPYTVEILYNGTSLGTVEVKVNVVYDSGLNEGWTEVGESAAGHKYVLDTNGIDYGSDNKYLIVGYLASNTDGLYDYALTANGSSTGAVHVDIVGDTITTNTRDYEWYFATGLVDTGSTTYNTFITQNGTTWLYHTDSSMFVGNGDDAHRGYWRVSDQGSGLYRFDDYDNYEWYLRYSGTGNKFTVKNSTSSNDVDVRLYKYDETILGGMQYVRIEGNTLYSVASGTTSTKALNKVKEGITAYLSYSSDGADSTVIDDGDLEYTWKNSYNGRVDGSYWLDISYNGFLLGTVEVVVEPGVINNYPEYPNEGSVKVDKQADSSYLQSTGVSKVELSASGIPVVAGVDVVVVVDTSSSMYRNYVGDTIYRRIEVLQDSMEEMIDDFNTEDPTTGMKPDIDVAIIDFNGYGAEYANMYGSLPEWGFTDNSRVYTGSRLWDDADAFVPASELVNFDVASEINNTYSGTNYDGGLKNAYKLLAAKAEANEQNGEVRTPYVIFLSDGAPFGWNGIIESDDDANGGNAAYSYHYWNELLQGKYDSLQALSDAAYAERGIRFNTQYEFLYDGKNGVHTNRWAEAIKGDPAKSYTVLDTVAGETAVESDLDTVSGLGATIYTIGFGLAVDERTVGSFTGTVQVDTMTEVLQNIASDDINNIAPDAGYDTDIDRDSKLYWPCQSADELANAFSNIVASIKAAATNARFVDQMGDSFDIQLESGIIKRNESGEIVGFVNLAEEAYKQAPAITIKKYKLYTKSQVGTVVDGVTVTEAMVGERYGDPVVVETVTFTDNFAQLIADGVITEGEKIVLSGAYSTVYGSDRNILVNGVITAQTFFYNTNPYAVNITLKDGSVYSLPGETFYWNIGTINDDEWVMTYFVYLEGSMQGHAPAGSYATNNFAILYYDNYLGNACELHTTSPQVGWESANVSYAFYLVDEEGNPIVNQTTGERGSFYNAVKLTQPVVYHEILLNNIDQINTIEAASLAVLPEGYELYDDTASYKVVILSEDGKGSWTVTYDASKVQSSYITGYQGTNASSEPKVTSSQEASGYDYALHTDYDYTHTTIWFAVVWSVKTVPDTVVVDFGLPVDIDVLNNDMFGENGKLVAVGPYNAELESLHGGANLAEGFNQSYTAQYGSAALKDGQVRYTPTTMQFNGYDILSYAVQYTGSNGSGSGYYYGTVKVIPATTVYFEDTFGNDQIALEVYEKNSEGAWVTSTESWKTVGQTIDAVQDEDRPGKHSLPAIDANNVYGKDSAYLEMSTYSMGSAAMINVNASLYGTAEFTFYGTGFDIISLTSNKTGTITVQVLADGNSVKNLVVDTYFGYERKETVDEEGNPAFEWVVSDSDAENALYQIPVMKVEGLTYGKYTVVITAAHASFFDHGQYDGTNYDFYLDAIRIYDPANDGASDSDTVIEDAYKADGEYLPDYFELRNLLISANDFAILDEDGVTEGIIFIDGNENNTSIEDYKNYGPNNELYLASKQAVVFDMDAAGAKVPEGYIIDRIELAVKTVGGAVPARVWNARTSSVDTAVERSIESATDMYYDITYMNKTTVVIYNSGSEGILSITNIKVTYKAASTTTVENNGETANAVLTSEFSLALADEEGAVPGLITISKASAKLAMDSMIPAPEPEPEPEPVFEPEKLTVKLPKGKIYEGDRIKIDIVTSGDVDYITVNGKTVDNFKYNRRTGEKTFTVQMSAKEAGEIEIEVTAVDAEGVESECLSYTVQVEAHPAKKVIKAITDILGKFFGGKR